MFLEAEITRRPDAVGRLADVPRRRHLPVRLLAARRPEHRRRRRVLRSRRDQRPTRVELAGARRREPAERCRSSSRQIEVANPAQGATTVVQLNRQRMSRARPPRIMIDAGPTDSSIKTRSTARSTRSARARASATTARSRHCPPTPASSSAPSSACSGSRRRLGFRRHLNLFARYAKGLAAFDELAPPTSFGPDLKTTKRERADVRRVGQLGRRARQHDVRRPVAPLHRRDRRTRRSRTTAGSTRSTRARSHASRPTGSPAPTSRIRRGSRSGLNPITLRAEDPAVFQIAPMVVFSPMGPSATTARSCGSSIARRTSTTARSISTCPTIRATRTPGSTSSACRPSGGSTRRRITR